MLKILFVSLFLFCTPTQAAINTNHEEALKYLGHAGRFGFGTDGKLEWYGPGVKPTEAALNSVMLAAAKSHRKKKVDKELHNKILKVYTFRHIVFVTFLSVIGVLPDTVKDAMKVVVLPIVRDAEDAKTIIDTLPTVASIKAFSW